MISNHHIACNVTVRIVTIILQVTLKRLKGDIRYYVHKVSPFKLIEGKQLKLEARESILVHTTTKYIQNTSNDIKVME